LYIADEGNNTIRKISSGGTVTTLAGLAGSFGSMDGTGAAARFESPRGIAIDGVGNLYVADFNNNTVRKITPAGVVTTVAGAAGTAGITDGSGTTARFNQPLGVSVDGSGNIYVADSGNNTIRKISPTTAVTTLAGSVAISGSVDATGLAARFDNPLGIATDPAGNIYIADTYNYIIRKSTPAGAVTTLAGTAGNNGGSDGVGAAASFSLPYSVAADSAGNVYVTETNSSAIRKITPAGVVTTLAGVMDVTGTTDGTGVAARFNRPKGLTVDVAGNIYVADTGNHAIRKITPAGTVTTLAGTAGHSGAMDGMGTAASFNSPQGIAVDSNGNVYVADTNNHVIRKIDSTGAVTTFAGSSTMTGSSDGSGTAARFYFPRGLATDASGNVYVADPDNNAIRKITPAGVVTTVAGTVGVEGFVPGPLPGVIAAPVSIAISGRNLYFLNHGNGVAVITNFP
jgi:streptogramin lyase